MMTFLVFSGQTIPQYSQQWHSQWKGISRSATRCFPTPCQVRIRDFFYISFKLSHHCWLLSKQQLILIIEPGMWRLRFAWLPKKFIAIYSSIKFKTVNIQSMDILGPVENKLLSLFTGYSIISNNSNNNKNTIGKEERGLSC